MPNGQNELEIARINNLLKAAKDKAMGIFDNISFDPQGRFIIDVPIPKPETTVSLDIEDPELGPLKAKFLTAIDDDLRFSAQIEDNAKRGIIINALSKAEKGSIIPLHQEFHFHLALAKRVYNQLKKDDGSPQFNEKELLTAHQIAMERINSFIRTAYAKALKDAIKKDGSLDIDKLNKSLDKSRKKITPIAHTIFMEEIVKQTGVVLTDKQLKTIKKIAEKTTATETDVLHLDHKLGLATLIEHSSITAHDRKFLS